MKSKVLSLVLAITLLAGIMVPTAAFAAASKGDEIAPATLKASISYGGTNSSNLAGVIRTTFADRGEVAGLITTNGLKPGGSAANGIAGFKVIPAGLDLTGPFTFEFEYYAKPDVWAELNFGGKDVFIANGNGVFINTRSAFNNTDGTAAAAAAANWHKVLVNFDGSNYRVYLNGVLLKDKDDASAFAPASTISNLIIGFYGDIANPDTGDDLDRLYVDSVYAYAGAYDPDGNSVETEEPEESEEPEVEYDVITITPSASNRRITASVTLSDKYATGYQLWLVCCNSNGDLNLIKCVDIEQAGYNELVHQFPSKEEEEGAPLIFGHVSGVKAYVWKTDYTPALKAKAGIDF